MAPLFNSTLVCNTPAACAASLDLAQELLEDARRLSHILGALLGIVLLLFICSPLIFNLPRQRYDYDTRRAPPPPQNQGIEMQDFESRDISDPDVFIVGSDEDESPNPSQSTFEDPSQYRVVEVEGQNFHIAKSDVTVLAETGVFRGAGDERQLAQQCVEEARAPSTASTPVLGSRSESAVDDGGCAASPRERIGTAVSV